MSFSFGGFANVEFGVFRGPAADGDVSIVPIDDAVKFLLHDMVVKTRNAMGLENEPRQEIPLFEPSERYDSESRVMLPLNNRLAERMRALYHLENIPTDADALMAPGEISAYFCLIHDMDNNKLMAIKRASQFKGILKAHLLRFVDNGLRAVNDTVFKLDLDFDIYIADETLYIKSVAAFEQMADIDEAVITAAVHNVRELERMAPAIGFIQLTDFVTSHKRAARIIAALRARADLQQTSFTNLRRECKRAGVNIRVVGGKVMPDPGYELGFLNILDRRRYAISLVSGRLERYEATSRRGVGVRERDGLNEAPPTQAPRQH